MDAHTGVLDTGELWRLTMEHSPVGMALVSPDGEILAANAALGDMLGYDPDELAHRTVADLTHPDDLATDLDLDASGDGRSTTVVPRAQALLPLRRQPPAGRAVGLLLRDAHGAPLQFIIADHRPDRACTPSPSASTPPRRPRTTC